MHRKMRDVRSGEMVVVVIGILCVADGVAIPVGVRMSEWKVRLKG